MPERPRRRTVRRAAKGAGAQGLDDVGVGPGAEAAAGGVDTRRRPAGVGAQHRPGASGCSRRARVREVQLLLDGLDQPHGLAFAGLDALRRRERPGRRLRLRRRQGDQPRAPSRPACPTRKSPDLGGAYAHALKSVAVGPDGAVYFSIGSTGNISAEDRDRDPAARHHHAGSARRRAVRSRSRPACATAPAWRSRPTARCGRRSTTATTSPVPDQGPSYGQVDARLRRRPSAGVARQADPGPRIGLAVLQSRRRPGQPAVDPRRADQRRRQQARLRGAAADRAEPRARTPRRSG